MIELGHQLPEPPELARHRASNPSGSWDADNFRPVRPIVRRQLHLEQYGLCVYCETELGEDEGHIEHVTPKGLNPALTFVYNNLAHSCQGPDHCGHHKKRQVLPILPGPGCNRFFSVMILDGRIVASAKLSSNEESQRADETVRILGLNCPSLSWQRKNYAAVIVHLPPEDRSEFIATIPFRWVLTAL